MARLEIQAGKHAGKSYDVAESAVLGRGETADVPVADTKASREHCRVQYSAGRWVVTDLGSRNGILVNGQPSKRKDLKDGDKIQIGQTVLVFHAGEGAPAAADEIEDEDELDLGLDVVEPVSTGRPPAQRPAQKRSGGSKASSAKKQAAFDQARAASAASKRSKGPDAGISVRDDVLQFSRVDQKKASIFDLELSQHSGLMQLAFWVVGLSVVALLVWGMLKLTGVTAG